MWRLLFVAALEVGADAYERNGNQEIPAVGQEYDGQPIYHDE